MIGLERGRVHIVPYQPEWKSFFQHEATLLRSIFGSAILCIEHIGSTAIEGMAAKPIIDLMCAVVSLDKAKALRPQLEALGYEYRPDESVPERLFFAKGPRINRTHHLSLSEPSSTFYKEKLLFRDYLRSRANAAEEYRRLKEELADRYEASRALYTEGKKAFVERILALAEAET
jgi:GrpB-like predicted nucleotidyltransferase (UPF0157 family)